MSDVLLTRPRQKASRITLAGYGRFLPAVFAAATTIALPSSNGGYFPVSWNWATLALAWVAALALLLSSRLRLGKLELAAVGGAFAYVLWTALSTTWSTAVPSTVLEVQRALVYPVGVLAALLLVRVRTVSNLLAGVLAGTTGVCGYALLTRLFPDQIATADLFGGYRLRVPLGYWNGLAVLAVIGTLLAVGFSAHSRSLTGRALAAVSLLVLLPTLFFTYSRGGWIALCMGLVVAVAIDSRRLWLITVLMVIISPAALAVWLGSRYHALTNVGATLEQAAHDGHRFAVEIALLAAAAAAGATVLGVAQRRFARPSSLVRRAYGIAVLFAAIVVLLAGFARYGSPWSIAHRGYSAITAKPTSDASTSLNKAFFNLSQQGRIQQWNAAWHDYEAHPWLGSGAGSYGRYWFQHRQWAYQVRDAHSLYMEALAELGPVGLALVVGFLLVPLAAAVRARRRRLVPFAAAAYCACLFHAGVDWDWEQTGVTLTAFLCGAALLVAARRPEEERRPVVPWVRFATLGGILAVAGFAFVGLLGNRAVSASVDAADSGQWRASASHARTAIRWAPWSPRGWQLLGEAQFELNNFGSARTSFLKALEKDPGDYSIWFDLGTATRGRAQIRAYTRARQLNPLDVNFAFLNVYHLNIPQPRVSP